MTPSPKYSIAQELWLANWDSEVEWLTCPDCGGLGYIRCFLHDDTMVTVGCEGCRRGYGAPDGKVQAYKRKPKAKAIVVTGVSIHPQDGIRYETTGGVHVQEIDLSITEDESMERAAAKCAEADAIERDRINHKERDTRSWAWHVHYHRREIREAERRIAYHSAKLAVAKGKMKDKSA